MVKLGDIQMKESVEYKVYGVLLILLTIFTGMVGILVGVRRGSLGDGIIGIFIILFAVYMYHSFNEDKCVKERLSEGEGQ